MSRNGVSAGVYVRDHRQAGLGLIELMVSMVIGLLVIGAAFGIFLSNNRAFSATQGLGRIQENSQAAFELMARDIREAGGNPCDAELPAANIITGASGATATAANWFVGWNQPLNGYNGSGLTNQVAGTDAIQVLRLDQDVRTLTANMVAGTGNFIVTPAAPEFESGDTIMVCDMRALGIFRTSSDSATDGTVSFAAGTNSCNYFPQPNAGVCAGTPTSYLFPKFSTVSRLRGVRWFVCNPDADAANGNSLCRQVDDGAAEEVIQGVQGMQIQYLSDAGYADSFASAADWNRVRAVRVSLTMQEPEPGNAAASGSTSGGPITRTFDHVVTLRNRAL